jgi:hypothetical protein
MALLYHSKLEKGQRPWELPRKKRASMEGTLFGLRWFVVIIDELHIFRNPGTKYFGVMRIFEQGVVKLGLTGTPLLTATKVRS